MNKVALAIGATSEIGEACACTFTRNGCGLILTGCNQVRLNQLTAELAHLNVDVVVPCPDACDHLTATAVLEPLDGKWCNVDVLVNNAGLTLELEPEYEGDFDDRNTMMNADIKELLTTTGLIVSGMMVRNRGCIINIGSVADDAAYANGSVYYATRTAIKVLSDGLRVDLVNTTVRVTIAKSGLVQTSFSVIRLHDDQTRADHVHDGIQPLTGDDIADVVLYVAQASQRVQTAEVLVLTIHRANGSTVSHSAA